MKQYNDLKDILKTTLQWEKDLKDLYDVASIGLTSDASKKLISYLKTHQERQIEVLGHIDVDKFGSDEWVQFANDFHVDKKVPKHKVTRDTSADDVVSLVLEYETVLRDFYTSTAERIAGDGQRELFESLAILKNGQIESLENYRLSHSA